MAVGPHESFSFAPGRSADLYLLRFGSDGGLRSPQTAEAFRGSLTGATDVFVFSHGWNNTFDVALNRYRSFITGFMRQRVELGLPLPEPYRPVLLGVVWPSTSFVLPWESGPQIAAGDPEGPAATEREEMLALVSSALEPAAARDLAELVDGRAGLDPQDARRAAGLVLAAFGGSADEGTEAPPPSVEELLATWALLDHGAAPVADDDDFGTVEDAPAPGGEPGIAGFSLDPRTLLRTATLWTMKARAGTVGARGLGPLVGAVLDHPSRPRLHLVGHSFGAKVVLSALATIPPPARRARSMLLLQPAVNRWCFAADVAGTGRSGGYRGVPDRVELPMLTTFSPHDAPLTQFFHLALRGGHLGEPQIAALGDPDLYGALGGFGPAGLGADLRVAPAAAPGTAGAYPLAGPARVVAVDGGALVDGRPAIGGHGDISNPATWWAMRCLAGAA